MAQNCLNSPLQRKELLVTLGSNIQLSHIHEWNSWPTNDIWCNDTEILYFLHHNLLSLNNKRLDQLGTFVWQRLLLSNDGDLSYLVKTSTVFISAILFLDFYFL